MGQVDRLFKLSPGMVIKGCWKKTAYQIDSLLGQGGCGTVYLVRDLGNKKSYALKMARDGTLINKEYQILSELNSENQIRRLNLVPRVYHLDDLWLAGVSYSYLVMEYVQGITLQELLRKKGRLQYREAVGVALLVALTLEKLHAKNYICGDLKAENFLYNQQSGQVTMIDFGGVSQPGQAVKAFTPVYDRASWGQGNRVADYQYDLFSLAMLIFILASGKSPQPKRQQGWKNIFFSFPLGKEYLPLREIIRKGLSQEYKQTANICHDLLALWEREKKEEISPGKLKTDLLVSLVCWASFLLLAFSFWLFYS